MRSQQTDSNIIVYGHNFCPQAHLLIAALKKHKVDYEWRDVLQGNPNFQTELKQLADGNLSVPTVIFADGTVMVEPWPGSVLKKLGLKKPNWLEKLLAKWLGSPNQVG